MEGRAEHLIEQGLARLAFAFKKEQSVCPPRARRRQQILQAK